MPRHVAVIMDGNGRWARERGLPRHLGHSEGMKAVEETVRGATDSGVEILTLYAFSTENWSRPDVEVNALMSLLQLYADRESQSLAKAGVRVKVLGEVERFDRLSRAALHKLMDTTSGGQALRLNLMISYGAREEIVRAARKLGEQVRKGGLEPSEINQESFEASLFTAGLPDPDLLIRSSGELRLSNFMLWQLAYTELYITDVYWPEFTREHFFQAILDYQRRERRYGRITAG